MEDNPSNFAQWQALAREAPERLVDHFRGKLELLSPESQRAFIASQADRDEQIQAVKKGCADIDAQRPLAGVPYLLQDLFDVSGLPTRCGAPFQDPFEAALEDSSLLYQKLTTMGATLLAKTVPAEFGVDPRGHNRSFGECPHAENLRFVCGGGAGSNAYAVSGGWAPLAFGLDSCGGVRIPAAFHGLFGFRMGNNAYARDGVFPIAPSIGSVAWVTAHFDDLLHSFSAFYPQNTSSETSEPPNGYFYSDASIQIDPELKAGLMHLVRRFQIDDSPSMGKQLARAFNPAAEAFSTIQSRELYSIHQYWIEEYRHRYDERVLRLIEAGQICTPDKADHAASIQQALRETFVDFFGQYDYLILPISPSPTPDKAQWSGQLENDLLRFNAPASLASLPAVILPFHCDEGRHGGIQILFDPRKLHHVPSVLKQVADLYSDR